MLSAIATVGVVLTNLAGGNTEVVKLTHHIQRFKYMMNKLC